MPEQMPTDPEPAYVPREGDILSNDICTATLLRPCVYDKDEWKARITVGTASGQQDVNPVECLRDGWHLISRAKAEGTVNP